MECGMTYEGCDWCSSCENCWQESRCCSGSGEACLLKVVWTQLLSQLPSRQHVRRTTRCMRWCRLQPVRHSPEAFDPLAVPGNLLDALASTNGRTKRRVSVI